jgi:uncharacterized protein YgiM (DUF1202 family)
VLSAGGSLYIPTVHPGWDETLIAARENRPNPTSPRGRANGQFLANSFRGAVSSGANIILIGTWNEFIENSHIEPSVQYGSQSLDILRPLVAEWKGTASAGGETTSDSAPSSEPTGAAVQAYSRLNVRAGASTDFDVLGIIAPGTWYAIIRQEGSWYVIDYNGREGYVSSQYVQSRGASTASASSTPPDYPAVQANSRLNVRAGASTDFDVLGVITSGSWYRIIREESGWIIIDFNGREGYLAAQFVRRN